MATASAQREEIKAGLNPMLRLAAYLLLAIAFVWALLLFRWMTFSVFDWQPFDIESLIAEWPPILPYIIYGTLLVVDLIIGLALLQDRIWARSVGIARSMIVLTVGLLLYVFSQDFIGAAFLVGTSGMMLVLLLRSTPWTLAYPAAFYLLIFFIIPIIIVLAVSLGDRSRLGTVTYPDFELNNLGAYLDDYVRFFSRIGGQFIYLRIFGRSVLIAAANTIICLLFGYPFAYWIARRPQGYRNLMVLLVMIPFWTNFLVRTYAWMLILRDSGLINNFWTITLHEQALMLADSNQLFSWLAEISESKLPLLFNQPAVLLGLFYGYLPFMILPLYANIDRLDWSLLEAASDLGAGRLNSIFRILIPLTMPGIVAGSIIVFIPSLGAYVTPDLMGGAKVSLIGNLLQQQFMTVRDWPFGSAIGFILMAIMLVAIIIYFRISAKSEAL